MNVILKVTKRCNLHCRYCYERPYQREAVALTAEQVAIIFRKIRDYYTAKESKADLQFIWHGGEPLVLPVSFYWEVLRLQGRFFDNRDRFEIINGIQTNLTLLDQDYLELFKTGRLGTIGVSFDVLNDHRVYRNGRATDDIVVQNLERLRAEGVPFSCLCVVGRRNVGQMERIYRFFRNRGISFNIVPVHHLPSEQQNELGITVQEYAAAAQRLFDLWFFDPEADIVITDFAVMIANLTHATDGPGSCYFSPRCPEQTIHLDPDGTAYLCSRMNVGDYAYGNIFRDSFARIMDSPARRFLLTRFDQIKESCGACDFFANCFGGCMNMGHTAGPLLDKSGMCLYYRTMFAHIRARLSDYHLLTKDGRLRRDYRQILERIVPEAPSP